MPTPGRGPVPVAQSQADRETIKAKEMFRALVIFRSSMVSPIGGTHPLDFHAVPVTMRSSMEASAEQTAVTP